MLYDLLIVDDELQSRNTLCTCFPWESLGFSVVGQADNGLEALEFLKHTSVHVILCDILMPICSGIELAQTLSSWPNPPLIVFLSGHRDFDYAQDAIRYGVRFYIVKPARFEELSDTFTTIREELNAQYLEASPATLGQEDQFIHKIKSYIETHYRIATLTEAAAMLYMNPSYVSQLFKQKTGTNFSDYLLEVRMAKACELLKDYSIKIYDISNQIGYTNAKNFARSFRNFYGLTPREYREKHQYRILEEQADELT